MPEKVNWKKFFGTNQIDDFSKRSVLSQQGSWFAVRQISYHLEREF
jgi:hypothetical protein